ncbi:hypothetical protein PIIN_08340 [Serendipita indica DSM 11827]|uniref:Uncharacterized protein n=1 Tax=Serendipita indica (strain DSM 11827) TaxID=1109443 RepID=G4TSU1_SERID|nr:hypothetical protein PIIN_08340 [Serendipita indica DSM 11827]
MSYQDAIMDSNHEGRWNDSGEEEASPTALKDQRRQQQNRASTAQGLTNRHPKRRNYSGHHYKETLLKPWHKANHPMHR